MKPVHQFDADMLPDGAFDAGALDHIVVGNRGRLLDARRTPVAVVGIDLESGQFSVRIEKFEDEGAIWEMPLESFSRFQFDKNGSRASREQTESYTRAVRRLERWLDIRCDPATKDDTLRSMSELRATARRWLEVHSAYLRSGKRPDFAERHGPVELAQDFRRFMEERSLWDLEDEFAGVFVSNPESGELVKGHRMVLAKLGLVPYHGKIARSASLFDDPRTEERRAQHILHRLAFLRELLEALDYSTLCLYRGLCSDVPPQPPRNNTFVSATFSFEVAKSCFAERHSGSIGVLYRQVVPAARAFMTYLETAQMNRRFLEAEAVLLWDDGNRVF